MLYPKVVTLGREEYCDNVIVMFHGTSSAIPVRLGICNRDQYLSLAGILYADRVLVTINTAPGA